LPSEVSIVLTAGAASTEDAAAAAIARTDIKVAVFMICLTRVSNRDMRYDVRQSELRFYSRSGKKDHFVRCAVFIRR